MSMETLLLSFLSDPESYPYTPDFVRIVQTHISIVSIAPPHVYKFKKNVNFGFLDYGTPEKRKENVEKELQLNRRLCSGIYEEIVIIYKKEGRLSFQEGDILEYGVKMKYMPDENCLLQICKQDKLSDSIIQILGKKLKDFYSLSPSIRSNYGTKSALEKSVLGNFEAGKNYLEGFNLFFTTWIQKAAESFFKNRASLLQERVKEGWIKDCHGDLRLEHVYISGESVCIYDCIEFNDNFRYIDIANDLAFLLMDLEFHAHFNAAHVLKNLVLQDSSSLQVLIPFYKSYRAYVRAKVNLLRASESEIPPEEKEKSLTLASDFIRYSLRYALAPQRPFLILVCGKVGTGKSTAASFLAGAFKIPSFNSDFIRKSMAGLDPFSPSDESQHAELYSAKATENTYRKMLLTSLQAVEKIHGVVVDATFSDFAKRDYFAEECRKNNILTVCIETFADDEIITKRLLHRAHEGKTTSDATVEEKRFMDSKFQSPEKEEFDEFFRLDMGVKEEVWQESLLAFFFSLRNEYFQDKP